MFRQKYRELMFFGLFNIQLSFFQLCSKWEIEKTEPDQVPNMHKKKKKAKFGGSLAKLNFHIIITVNELRLFMLIWQEMCSDTSENLKEARKHC